VRYDIYIYMSLGFKGLRSVCRVVTGCLNAGSERALSKRLLAFLSVWLFVTSPHLHLGTIVFAAYNDYQLRVDPVNAMKAYRGRSGTR
jgi:hypothetical protein